MCSTTRCETSSGVVGASGLDVAVVAAAAADLVDEAHFFFLFVGEGDGFLVSWMGGREGWEGGRDMVDFGEIEICFGLCVLVRYGWSIDWVVV